MRRKKSGIRLEHKAFGFGAVLHKKITDYGDAIVVQFAGKTRTVLVETDGWVNADDAAAAFKAAPGEPRPKEAPRKALRVRAVDDVAEEIEVVEEEV